MSIRDLLTAHRAETAASNAWLKPVRELLDDLATRNHTEVDDDEIEMIMVDLAGELPVDIDSDDATMAKEIRDAMTIIQKDPACKRSLAKIAKVYGDDVRKKLLDGHAIQGEMASSSEKSKSTAWLKPVRQLLNDMASRNPTEVDEDEIMDIMVDLAGLLPVDIDDDDDTVAKDIRAAMTVVKKDPACKKALDKIAKVYGKEVRAQILEETATAETARALIERNAEVAARKSNPTTKKDKLKRQRERETSVKRKTKERLTKLQTRRAKAKDALANLDAQIKKLQKNPSARRVTEKANVASLLREHRRTLQS